MQPQSITMNLFCVLIFQSDDVFGQQTGMVLRLQSETDQEFASSTPLNLLQAIPDAKARFYFGWARPAIYYNNMTLAHDTELSTANVVKITAVYGESFILIPHFVYPNISCYETVASPPCTCMSYSF
jgi:hypothetical protein